MKRRNFLKSTLAVGLLSTTEAARFAPELSSEKPLSSPRFSPRSFEFEEATLEDLQRAMRSGRSTSAALTGQYLERIQEIDRRGPEIRSVIELNPEALEIAKERDKDRAAGRIRGPLHGIPVLLKDNIDTHDRMSTSAGSLALSNSTPARDSFVMERLRAAGAVLLGKTNLSEWANFRGSNSVSGWSGRGLQTRNPYILDRNPSGSSSGSGAAVAANLCAVAIGTETDGSILSPSSVNGLVGIKPTVGLISRTGIIPISASQDTAGPMARTVTDAAVLLAAMVGTDTRDPATSSIPGNFPTDFAPFLKANGLQGARLGVVREFFSFHPAVERLMASCLSVLKDHGAVLVDPVELPHGSDRDSAENEVLHFEFKAGINAYLAQLPPSVPVRSLADLIRFNQENQSSELKWFGQETFIKAESKGPLTEPSYLKALATCRRISRDEGIDATLQKHALDALIAPTGGPAWLIDWVLGDSGTGGSTSPAAVAGYPGITVPAGQILGLPIGLSFFGKAWSEPRLLTLAYAFEQATSARRIPGFFPTLPV